MSSEEKAQSQRELGIWMSTALVVGNMIASGVFLLPASLAVFGGISIFGWLFTTTGAVLLAMVFSTLSRMVPKAGGPYVYTRHGFGDFAGFIVAWGYWISILAGNAAIAVALAGYLGVFWPAVSHTPSLAALTAISVVWILTYVNSAGIRNVGYIQVVTTVLKLLPLILIAIVGFFHFNLSHFHPFNLSSSSSFSAITATATLTLWAFLGLESATIPADNVKEPQKTIPRATILGTLIAAVIYILATVAVMGIVAPSDLAKSTAPFSDAATSIWNTGAGYAVAVGAVISCFGALNGWILLQGQIPLATARDRLFPAIFGKVSRRGTPTSGLVISSLLVTVLISVNYTKGLVELFTFIILLAALTSLLPYIFCAMSELLLFMRNRDQFSKPKLVRASVVAILAFLYSLWAVAGAGQETVYWGFLLILAGFPVYVWIKWQNRDHFERREG